MDAVKVKGTARQERLARKRYGMIVTNRSVFLLLELAGKPAKAKKAKRRAKR